MSQNAFNESNESGASFRAGMNAALQALASTSSGTSAPATPYAQQLWVDTDTPSSTVWTLNMYDGTDWIPLGFIDSSNNVLLPYLGGGTATLASATTVDLGASPQSTLTISGTTDVSGFGSTMKPGQSKIVIASGTWKLKYNATSLKIPGSADFTMTAGDKTIVTCTSTGNYDVMVFPKSGQSVAVGANRVTCYQVADATDISLSSVPTQTNVGATVAMTIPAKGTIEIVFTGQTIVSSGTDKTIFGLRIGSTNYWPTLTDNGSNTYVAAITTGGGTSSFNSYGAQTVSTNSPGDTTVTGLGIQELAIPTGSQTVQVIAGMDGSSVVLRGTAKTSRVYITVKDHS